VRQLLVELCDSEDKQKETLEAVSTALKALNNFLTGMENVQG